MLNQVPVVQPVLEALRRAVAFVDSPETAHAVDQVHGREGAIGLAEQLAAVALVWTARQLRALTLLLEHGYSLEAEPILRSVLENAITIAWVGRDPERAERYRNNGLDQFETWVECMSAEEPALFSEGARRGVAEELSKRTDGKKMPGVEVRAREARTPFQKEGLLRRAYQFSYRRLCAAVHADFRLIDLILNEPKGLLSLDAQDGAVAAAITIACAGQTLGIAERAFPIAADLIAAAHLVRRNSASDGAGGG